MRLIGWLLGVVLVLLRSSERTVLEEARSLARSATKRAVTSGFNSAWAEWAMTEYPWLADKDLVAYLDRARKEGR